VVSEGAWLPIKFNRKANDYKEEEIVNLPIKFNRKIEHRKIEYRKVKHMKMKPKEAE